MQANADSSTDLATLSANAEAFITLFRNLHTISHQYVLNLQDICDVVGFRIDYLISIVYAQDVNRVQCELESFVAFFLTIQLQAEANIGNLVASCTQLIGNGNEFGTENDLTCEGQSFGQRGCDATLNGLKSTLTQWLADLQVAFNNAVDYVGGIVQYCSAMGYQAGNYTAPSGQSWQKRQSNSNVVSTFNKNYNNARSNLQKLLDLCTNLVTSINTLDAKIQIAGSGCCATSSCKA